ncbi:AAA family ATPase [Aliarcobacter butzleri]|uniref:ATP-binding protein n=1 Tax=Aliarcobacter butzleri TaxID=28197 RepID=UPI003AF4A1D9
MELVYLWVENYKNIHKQGFNFSPRFRCEFKDEYEKYIDTDGKEKEKLKDNCELIIEKKEYKSIFPDNINITAIVGENGSGKSNLTKLLLSSIVQNKDNWHNIKNILLVFKDYNTLDEKIFTFSGIKENNDQFVDLKINRKAIEKLYSDNKCIKINDFLEEYYYLFIDFSIMDSNIWNNKNYKEKFSIEPSRDYKTSGPEWSAKLSATGFDSNMKANLVYFYKLVDKELKIKFNIPLFDTIKIYGKKRVSTDKVTVEINNAKKFYKRNQTFLNLTEDNFDKNSFKSENKNISDITDYELDAISYFDTFCDIELSIKDENLFFYNLSTGTKTLLSYFGIICKTIIKRLSDKKKLFILIDEIENSLHPNWQKEFLNMLIIFLSNWEKTKDLNLIHIILVSHSPFILSDIPKENVIFLEKGKQVYPFEDGKQTFGANIHTLLSHGFFMKDGLMGEFAKEKIDLAIKYLNQKILTEDELNYCENIISIIGEPIIKRELQRKLDSKRLSKIDKIEEIEEQMKLLQNRLEMIRKNQK